MDKKRYHELDLLRFLAALAVVFYHYTFRGYVADRYSPVEFPLLSSITRYGYLGVDLFFIISGFVILLSAWDRNFERFAISRAVRLYPAYWFSCTLTFLVALFFAKDLFAVTPFEYLANLTMVHEAVYIRSVDGVYWTLFVELRFYMLIALLLVFKRIKNIEWFLAVWAAIASLYHFDLSNKYINFFLIPEWASYFISGCVFFLIKQGGWSLLRIALLGGSFALSAVMGLERQDEIALNFSQQFDSVVFLAILIAFYGLFLLIALEKFSWLNVKALTTLGMLTYPLYLVHQVIGYILLTAFDTVLHPWLNLLAVIGLMIILSLFICKVIEPAVGKLLRQILEVLFSFPSRVFGSSKA